MSLMIPAIDNATDMVNKKGKLSEKEYIFVPIAS